MKKSIWSILAAFVLLLSASGSAWAYAPSVVHKPGALAYEHTKYLSEEIGSRVTGTEGESLAKEYIKKQFEEMGYNPDVQEFSFTKRGTTLSSSNVIAYKKGKSSKQIIVGAHSDSVKTGKGADDNASGVGVMLEAAHVLQKVSTPYSIVFIAFGAEEGGLNGSNFYASQMTAAEINNTVGMINLDSLAVGDKMYVHGGAGDAGFIREQALNIAEKKKLDIGINPGLNEHYPAGTTGDWSDHAPFNELGIPFAYLESTNWEIGDLDGYEQTLEYGGVWHTENDTLAFIETAYPGRIQERLSSYSQVLTELLKHFNKTSTSK
ncbi:M20/M25/M40 family metallo-hydrolase [Bacillus sp. ISL-35]|uniref:M20/M25/M40 family metallo-hydrolase n=1 Tax=Bacillus sp. ISL-35 TaxID=2819122 RepID=UPI001BE92B9B|nr:M20/M25/M40 family metallo-hydrolase [Bacillus sp. ISL-35]MBT2681967.1 M20/M25/M40 family metallo-hydrolase [Bacillus sp. ISL-35]MBT2706149.1 M20/M25/M40 family metallo-hydrolase [Chryseobacterium sp. ISL-80]